MTRELPSDRALAEFARAVLTLPEPAASADSPADELLAGSSSSVTLPSELLRCMRFEGTTRPEGAETSRRTARPMAVRRTERHTGRHHVHAQLRTRATRRRTHCRSASNAGIRCGPPTHKSQLMTTIVTNTMSTSASDEPAVCAGSASRSGGVIVVDAVEVDSFRPSPARKPRVTAVNIMPVTRSEEEPSSQSPGWSTAI